MAQSFKWDFTKTQEVSNFGVEELEVANATFTIVKVRPSKKDPSRRFATCLINGKQRIIEDVTLNNSEGWANVVDENMSKTGMLQLKDNVTITVVEGIASFKVA